MKLVLMLWTFVFHNAFAQWQSLNEPMGGYVRDITSHGDVLFATTGGGVLVSLDKGNNWAFKNTGLLSHDCKSIIRFGDYVFVSTDEGIFRSKDQGVSWEIAGKSLQGVYVKSILVHNNALFAGTYLKGVFRSIDFGETWEELDIGFPAKYIYSLNSDGSQLFAGTYLDGLLKSTDNGESWVKVNNGITDSSIMSVFSFAGRTIIGTLEKGIFITSNGGESWKSSSKNIKNVKGFSFDNNTLYAASASSGVLRSFDYGENWEQIPMDFYQQSLWAIHAFDGGIILGSKTGQLYRNAEGKNEWNLVFDQEVRPSVGLLDRNGKRLMVGTRGSGFYSKTSDGDDWRRASDIWTVENRGMVSVNNIVLVGTDMLGIFRSTNGGKSFHSSNSGLKSNWIQAFAHSKERFFAGSADEGVFVSEDLGVTWKKINEGLRDYNITALSSDGENVFLGSFSGGVYRLSGKTEAWVKVSRGLPENDLITGLKTINGVLFVGTKTKGLFVSYDQGLNWSSLSTAANIRSMYVKESTLFIGTAQGRIFYTKDIGVSWYEVDVNHKRNSAILALLEFEGFMYAGFDGDGLWRVPYNNLDLNLQVSLSSQSVMRNTPSGHNVGTLKIIGASGGTEYNYSISGKDTEYLRIDKNKLFLKKSLEEFDSSVLEVVVSVTNSNGLIYTVPLFIEVEDVVTGVESQEEILKLNIYPVPAEDVLKISLPRQFTGRVEFVLLSLKGGQEILKRHNDFSNRTAEPVELDVRFVPSGLYLLKVKSIDFERSVRVLIK